MTSGNSLLERGHLAEEDQELQTSRKLVYLVHGSRQQFGGGLFTRA